MEKRIYPLQTRELMKKLLDQHYQEARQAKEMGKKVVWCAGQAPTDILVAMDFIPVFPENLSCMSASRGVSTEMCQTAEAHDFSAELCSYGKTNLGAIFSGWEKSPIGEMPRPDLLYAPSLCSTHIKWFENLSRMWDVPILVLDTPMVHDSVPEDYVTKALEYIRLQLQEHIAILEGMTGRRLNWSRLQEVMDCTSKAGRLYGQAVEAAKHRPSPITAFDHFIHLGPLVDWRGFPQAVEYYQELNREIADRVSQGFSAVGEENFRLYWDSIPAWFRLGYVGRKLAQYGACCVLASYPIGWVTAFGLVDPERPLESTAEAQLYQYLNTGTARRTEHLAHRAAEFGIEGFVMQTSRTCKVYSADQVGIMKAIQERTGLPAVIVEGDMCDGRFFSEGEVDSRLEAFLELVSKGKAES